MRIIYCHTQSYEEVWELQKQHQRALIAGGRDEVLIVCEHPPTITVGRSAKSDSLLVPESELAARGVKIFRVERGGDLTYHGPGQLVFYPIIDLGRRQRDVNWYMRTLEGAVIQALQSVEIEATRVLGRTGVWLQPPEDVIQFAPAARIRKICSIGVRLSRWCSLHGLAVNIRDCSAGFALINPCGYGDIAVTSVQQELAERWNDQIERRVQEALVSNCLTLLSCSSGDNSAGDR